MGGLRKHMPITYWTMLIGALASAGIPGFSGFFSKDAIIEAAHFSRVPGAGFAYFAVLTCVFVTALYTFRLLFMTFHGKEHFHGQEQHGNHSHGDTPHGHAPHESPAVVTVTLIALAVPSICVGWLIGPVLFGGYFGSAIAVAPGHDVLAAMGKDFHGVVAMILHAFGTAPFWFALAGIATATYLYLLRPDLPAMIKEKAGVIYTLLDRKYWFDEAYSFLFVGGARSVGTGLWKGGDVAVIDGVVNGSAGAVGWFAQVIRPMRGYIYRYAFTMIIGVLLLLTFVIYRLLQPLLQQ